MSRTDTADAPKTITADETNVKWYSPAIGDHLRPATRKLLEEYAKIPSDEVEDLIYKIVSLLSLPRLQSP